MNHLAFRPAQPADFAFCRRLYFEGIGETSAERHQDEAQQIECFTPQWEFAAVRIIMIADAAVGWLQTAPTDDATDLGQFYVDRRFQRQGIGRSVLRALIEEALRINKAVILCVLKINPARRLYERLGFRVAYEDSCRVYMRREPDCAAA
jgi:ribosomal protein S18 acetylase RimI-like enzyme